jgi:uncharacterized protein (DUF305 family)
MGPAVLAAVALPGCGGDGFTSSPAGRAADAAFIADMTAHHDAAIQMARLARHSAEHRPVRRLARDIVDAQKSELTIMRHIADHLGDPPVTAGGGHMGMSDAAMGMGMDPTTLENAKPFDRAFIDLMIPHHQGAIAMAEQHLHRGEHHNLRVMARRIIEAQPRRSRSSDSGARPGTARASDEARVVD